MTRRTAHTRDAGFTLVEVLVAMTLTVLLGGLAFAVLAQVTQASAAWQRQMAEVNARHVLRRTLSADLRASHTLRTEGATVRLAMEAGTVRYQVVDATLLRNGRHIGGKRSFTSIKVTTVETRSGPLYAAELVAGRDTLRLSVQARERPFWPPRPPP